MTILDEIMDDAAALVELKILPPQATDTEILDTLNSMSGAYVASSSVAAKLAVSSFRNAVIVKVTRQIH